MLIISKDKFYSHGVSWVLKSLYQELSYDPSELEINIYIMVGMNTSSIIDLLDKHQPERHSVFICNSNIQEIIRARRYSGKKTYIDERASAEDVRTVLKKIIVRDYDSSGRMKIKKKICFSDREMTVLELLVKGFRVERIANACNMSLKIVHAIRYNLTLKSGSLSLHDLYYFHLNERYEFTDINQFLVYGNRTTLLKKEDYTTR